MRLKIFLLFFFFAEIVQAQPDNIWYFGQNAGLKFNNCTPEALTDSNFVAAEGGATISDAYGMLFYTNGTTVWNTNHEVMENGTGLFGSTSSCQSAIIIPQPGNTGRYYIFTTDSEGGAKGLCYSEVVMSAANGLGAVMLKNVPLITPVSEKLAATWHANGTDIWVTVQHWGSDAFYSYLVTGSGVSLTPVISHSGTVIIGAPLSNKYVGFMKISPDGSHLAVTNSLNSAQLFNFDNATGILSNPVTIRSGVACYGLEFSPSGNLLYMNIGNEIFQYQVNAPDVTASQLLLTGATVPAGVPMQLGPDGKLYLTTYFINRKLSVINNPDVPGLGCNLELNTIDLDGKLPLFNFPAFLTSTFYLTNIISNESCSGSEVSFSVETTDTPEVVVWYFGDGTSAIGSNLSHTYTSPGTYTVTAFGVKKGYVRCRTKKIVIQALPVANQPQDMMQCEAGNDQADFILTAQNAQILGTQPAADYTITYHLTAQQAEAGNNALTSPYPNISNPQQIFARITSNASTCYAVTSFALIVKKMPVIEMEDTYYLCNNDLAMRLYAPSGFTSYLWSNGDTTPYTDAAEGAITLTVFLDYGAAVCQASKTITIKRSRQPVIKNTAITDWTDDQNTIIVETNPGNYQYSIDGVNYQDSPVFSNLKSGPYTIYVKDKNGCGITEKQIYILMYPRFFTPNSDGYHDYWQINYAIKEPGMTIRIFDRFGKLLAVFTGADKGWDGKYNNKDLPSTDYWFTIIRQDGRELKGHFAMKR